MLVHFFFSRPWHIFTLFRTIFSVWTMQNLILSRRVIVDSDFIRGSYVKYTTLCSQTDCRAPNARAFFHRDEILTSLNTRHDTRVKSFSSNNIISVNAKYAVMKLGWETESNYRVNFENWQIWQAIVKKSNTRKRLLKLTISIDFKLFNFTTEPTQ